jgi:hypothetical protein
MEKIAKKNPGFNVDFALSDFEYPPNFHVTVLYIGNDT